MLPDYRDRHVLAISNLASFYTAGIVLGLAATTIIVAVKTLMSHWFDRNQGLSLGVVMMGSSAAGIVLPFFAAPLINAHGWRVTFALMSLGIWLVGLPLFLLVTRETPSEPTYRNQLVRRDIETVADISPLDHANARTS